VLVRLFVFRIARALPFFALALAALAAIPANASTLTISTTSLPTAHLNTAYSATLAAAGGSGTGYKWSVASGALPTGLSLAATGAITGKPTIAETAKITVKVVDSANHSATAALNLTVSSALQILTAALPTGYIGIVYSDTLTAAAGSGTGYKWSVSAGSLPSGFTLGSATGILTGKSTVASSSTFTVKVTDSLSHTATAAFTLKINPDLAITTTTLKVGYQGTKYSMQLAAAGGSGAGYAWSISTGTLPAGLTLSSAGLLAGTPTVPAYVVVGFEVKDSAGNIAKANLAVSMGYPLIITSSATLPVGYIDASYTATLAFQGGSYVGLKWTATGLPQGINFSSTGVFSGTPAVAQTSTIDVKVVDSAGNSASALFTLIVNPAVSTCTNDHPTTALVELHGVYTFAFHRFNLTTGHRTWSLGSFDADGLGNIKNGVMDTNGPEMTLEQQNTFTGAYTVGSDERGRMTMVVPATDAGQQAQTYAFCFTLDALTGNSSNYKSESHASVVEDDATNNVASGDFYLQTVPPSVVSVKGTWVFGMAGRRYDYLTGLPDFRSTSAGYVTFDGTGIVTAGEVDQNKDGVTGAGVLTNKYTAQTALTGTYTLPTSTATPLTGRGTLSVAGANGKYTNFVFYPSGVDRFELMVSDPGFPNSGAEPAVLIGVAYRRTGPVNSDGTGLLGTTVRSRYFLTDPGETTEGPGFGIDLAVWNGKGNFTYSGDTNANGVVSTPSGSGTYSVDANGRFAVMVNGLCSPCGYLNINNSGFAIYDSTDASLEVLEFQDIPIGGDFQLSSLHGSYSVGDRWYFMEDEQTNTGQLISKGTGTITGTLDQNTQGDTKVNQAISGSEVTTSTSGAKGRFLLNLDGTTSALYIVGVHQAISIPISGVNLKTQPILQYIHQ
jgi:hypothetical protein